MSRKKTEKYDKIATCYTGTGLSIHHTAATNAPISGAVTLGTANKITDNNDSGTNATTDTATALRTLAITSMLTLSTWVKEIPSCRYRLGILTAINNLRLAKLKTHRGTDKRCNFRFSQTSILLSMPYWFLKDAVLDLKNFHTALRFLLANKYLTSKELNLYEFCEKVGYWQKRCLELNVSEEEYSKHLSKAYGTAIARRYLGATATKLNTAVNAGRNSNSSKSIDKSDQSDNLNSTTNSNKSRCGNSPIRKETMASSVAAASDDNAIQNNTEHNASVAKRKIDAFIANNITGKQKCENGNKIAKNKVVNSQTTPSSTLHHHLITPTITAKNNEHQQQQLEIVQGKQQILKHYRKLQTQHMKDTTTCMNRLMEANRILEDTQSQYQSSVKQLQETNMLVTRAEQQLNEIAVGTTASDGRDTAII